MLTSTGTTKVRNEVPGPSADGVRHRLFVTARKATLVEGGCL